MTKLLGERFTLIDVTNPVGYFFEAMYQTGFYWNFLGLAQLFAAVLLMSQRFATLGVFIFSGIMVNIWLITISVGFKGTWVITSLMMLAVIYLVAWDWNKLRVFFLKTNKNPTMHITNYPEAPREWVITGTFLFFLNFFLFLATRYIQIDKDDTIVFLLIFAFQIACLFFTYFKSKILSK